MKKLKVPHHSSEVVVQLQVQLFHHFALRQRERKFLCSGEEDYKIFDESVDTVAIWPLELLHVSSDVNNHRIFGQNYPATIQVALLCQYFVCYIQCFPLSTSMEVQLQTTSFQEPYIWAVQGVWSGSRTSPQIHVDLHARTQNKLQQTSGVELHTTIHCQLCGMSSWHVHIADIPSCRSPEPCLRRVIDRQRFSNVHRFPPFFVLLWQCYIVMAPSLKYAHKQLQASSSKFPEFIELWVSIVSWLESKRQSTHFTVKRNRICHRGCCQCHGARSCRCHCFEQQRWVDDCPSLKLFPTKQGNEGEKSNTDGRPVLISSSACCAKEGKTKKRASWRGTCWRLVWAQDLELNLCKSSLGTR